MVQIALPFLLFAAATPVAQKAPVEAPPCTVYLKGGKTQIGNKVKTIDEMLETYPAMQKYASGFVSETPLVKEDVAPFFLMVNEVSGEQYAAFVEAMSYQPRARSVPPAGPLGRICTLSDLSRAVHVHCWGVCEPLPPEGNTTEDLG